MINRVPAILVLVALLCGLATGAHASARGEPVRIIFDTDMGSDCDDAGALAVLHVYADRGLAEIIGCIYSSGKVPYGAGIVEAINVYYGRPEIPIGAAHDDDVGDPVDKMTAEKLAKDTTAFGNTIIHSRDAGESGTFILMEARPTRSIWWRTVPYRLSTSRQAATYTPAKR